MNNIKEVELIKLFLSLKEMEEKYRNKTNINAPRTYRKMREIYDKINQLSLEISKDTKVTSKAVYEVYNDIAKDARFVYNINSEEFMGAIEKGIVKIKVFNFQEFLEKYVSSENNVLFYDLFWYIDSEKRIDYLKDSYLYDLDIYYTRRLEYLVLFEVDEEDFDIYRKLNRINIA